MSICSVSACGGDFPIAQGESCFKVINNGLSWINARRDCASYPDAELVNIEDAAENEALRAYLGGGHYWIGEILTHSIPWLRKP